LEEDLNVAYRKNYNPGNVWILTSSAYLGKAAINADATIKANPLNVISK
jgi:hypothetical protein